ncbi:MAG: hypothetical protein Q9186_004297 [Xanthomendoza sp. 1 TL-2023]
MAPIATSTPSSNSLPVTQCSFTGFSRSFPLSALAPEATIQNPLSPENDSAPSDGYPDTPTEFPPVSHKRPSASRSNSQWDFPIARSHPSGGQKRRENGARLYRLARLSCRWQFSLFQAPVGPRRFRLKPTTSEASTRPAFSDDPKIKDLQQAVCFGTQEVLEAAAAGREGSLGPDNSGSDQQHPKQARASLFRRSLDQRLAAGAAAGREKSSLEKRQADAFEAAEHEARLKARIKVYDELIERLDGRQSSPGTETRLKGTHQGL